MLIGINKHHYISKAVLLFLKRTESLPLSREQGKRLVEFAKAVGKAE